MIEKCMHRKLSDSNVQFESKFNSNLYIMKLYVCNTSDCVQGESWSFITVCVCVRVYIFRFLFVEQLPYVIAVCVCARSLILRLGRERCISGIYV